MSSDPNPAVTDLRPKPMKGKYDGRKNNGATKARRRINSNLGRKPLWLKNMSRNEASKTLGQFDSIAEPAELYRKAWEKGDIALCASLYKQFQERHLGRPFIAENPEKANKADSLQKDAKLQDALQRLLPAKPSVM